ncbi:MAG TPA: hydrogenase expression/formation protein HypE [Desulfurivibrionaceae bacterium]|nr:hydrogenase expression/formation protein HypE [Desulfurivibrionaceae bacterium]
MSDDDHTRGWSGGPVCPLPLTNHDTVQLAHGSGGRMSAELVAKFFQPRFSNPYLDRLEDQAMLPRPSGRLALSTDTFVVDPLFFPGGSIGDLAINGTVNDVCMSGATPLYLSAGFVLEEGLPLATLHRILLDMEKAARQAGVAVVTGDTKVVPRGSCDKIFINTTGLGVVPEGLALSAASLAVGDLIVLSGTVTDHGMAVMTCRQGLSFQASIASDIAPLQELVATMLLVGREIRAMRDPTRGGLAATLNEFAISSAKGLVVERELIPVRPEVAAACEILGIDPLVVANEGKLLAVVEPRIAEAMVAAMRKHPLGRQATVIGEVVGAHPGLVAVKNSLGISQVLEMPLGEQLPRIC